MEQQGYEEALGQAQQGFRPAGTHEMPHVRHSDWRRDLRRTILARVVPRLSEIGHEGGAAPQTQPPASVTAEQVVHFAGLVLAASVPSLIHYIEDLRSAGLGIDAVLLQLLAPAARHLGDLWLADRLSFLDVTGGLGRLQGIMRALGPDLEGDGLGFVHGKKILLAPISGEQHIFGLSVVAAFFRRAGWDVTFEPRILFEDMLTLIRAQRFNAIGLSVATDKALASVNRQVDAIRNASLARNVTLLAGGAAFLLDPDLYKNVGVDAVARDATEAVQMAEALSGQASSNRASP